MTANETNTAAAIRSHTSELADMLSSAVKSLSLDEESVASYKHASGLKFEITFSMSGNEADKDNSAKANNANGTASATKSVYVSPQDIITTSLLEGYVLDGNVCATCSMPTMALKGNAACVVCTASTQIKNSISYETSESAKKVESYDRLEKAKKDTDDMFSVALKTGEDKESLVNRVTSAFSERRFQSTEVYATMIMEGYVMHEDLCGTCDMPMMEYAKSICCVLCKEKVIEEEIAEEEVDEEKVEDSGVPEVEEVAQEAANQHGNESLEDSKETDANQTSELPKENKELSRAEKLAERLRNMTSQSNGENAASQLDAVEQEIMQMIQCLEMCEKQGNGNKSFEDFHSRQDAALSVMSKFQKGRKEIEDADANVIFEAEAVAKNEGRCDDDVPEEDWDTRVFEGRALMNRRRLQGWTILNEVCVGKNCNATPLMHSENGCVECVVCRGSGNGKDGAYAGYNITKNHANPDKTANPEEIAVEDDVDNNADCNIPRAVLVGDHCDDIDDSSIIFTVIADDTKCSEKVNTATIAVEEDYFFPNKKNNSMSCSVGEVIIPSLRHIFAGMSHLIKGDTGKKENQLKAKEKISQLVQMGWEVSSDQCTSCDMPLFSKAEGMRTNKLCVLCGPISGNNFANPASSQQHIHNSMNEDFQERASNEMARLMLAGWTFSNDHVCEQCVLPLLSNPASDLLHCVGCVIRSTHASSANPSMMNFGTRDILDLDNKAQEMISRKMVNQVMAGWTIVEGKQCQSCSMPVMRDPQTHLAHCVACGGHADNFGTSFQPLHHHQAMHHQHQAFGSRAGNYRMRVVPMTPQPYAGNHHSMSSSKMRVMQGNLSTLVRAETPSYYQEAKGRDPTPSNTVAPTVEAFHMYDPPTGRTPSNMANNRRHFE